MRRSSAIAVPACSVPAFLLLVLSWGCGGDDDGGAADGSAADAGEDGLVAAIAPPDLPWLEEGAPPIAPPELTPCPDGWREVAPSDGSVAPTTCDPYPVAGPGSCPAGQAHFPGEPGCAPVGSSCPSGGEFSDSLPSDRAVVYVQPGATGDGSSAASPYGSLSDFGIGGLSMGTVIALSRGMHAGPVRLTRGVALWGACAAGTVLSASAPAASDGVVTVRGGPGEVRDMTVADSPRPGVWLDGTAGVLEGVIVERTETFGVAVAAGARLDAAGLLVRDTRARGSDGARGRGLGVGGGSTADVTRALIERNRDVGLFADAMGTAVTMADVVVRDTEGELLDASGGRGLSVQNGATAQATRVLIERNRDLGVFALGRGAAVTLSHAIVRDTQSQMSDGTNGNGLSAQEGATVRVMRALVERNRNVGVLALDVGTAVTLDDAVVRDTESRESDGRLGSGLSVNLGASVQSTRAVFERNHQTGVFADAAETTLTMSDAVVASTEALAIDSTLGRGLNVQGGTLQVTRGLFDRNRDIGVFVGEASTAVTLTDIAVRDTESEESDGTGGRGLNVQDGATVVVSRALFERNRDVAVLAREAGTAVTLSDAIVRDTRERSSDGTGGRGLSVQFGASTEVMRALFERNRNLGVVANEAGSTVMLFDTVVRDTEGENDGNFGRGLAVQLGATAEATRVLFERNREVDVIAHGVGSSATLIDAVVRDSRERACAETTCSDSPAGHGIGSYGQATVTVTGFVVEGAAFCGAHLAQDGQMDLSDGEVRGQPIGVCLQVEGYDLERLTDDVVFDDNGVNLQSTELPVPEPVEELPESGP